MEKLNSSVRNGGIMKLPIGFRFHPTDEELVVHYLKRKVYSVPLPASVIPELDVHHINPWDLPAGDLKEKRYFFSKRKGDDVRSRSRSMSMNSSSGTRTGSGYWKAIGKDKQIVGTGSKQAVGMKKSLVFYQGKRSRGLKTRWVMHEYRLLTSPKSTQEEEEEDWVVCRIYQRKRKAKNHAHDDGKQSNSNKYSRNRPYCIMIMEEEDSTDLGPPQPSSSCSSGITTHLSSDDQLLDEEATSPYLH